MGIRIHGNETYTKPRRLEGDTDQERWDIAFIWRGVLGILKLAGWTLLLCSDGEGGCYTMRRLLDMLFLGEEVWREIGMGRGENVYIPLGCN